VTRTKLEDAGTPSSRFAKAWICYSCSAFSPRELKSPIILQTKTRGRDFLESDIIVALAAEQKISHRDGNNGTPRRLKINEIVT
jgi:hypothetical protein